MSRFRHDMFRNRLFLLKIDRLSRFGQFVKSAVKFTMRKSTLYIIIFSMSGCTISPHTEILAPEIRGILTQNDIPLSNVTIEISRPKSYRIEQGCKNTFQITKTNEKGEFLFLEDKHFVLFNVMGDSIFTWEICANINQNMKSIWIDSGIGIVTEDDNTEIYCDILQEPNKVPDGYVYCRKI